MQNFPATLRIAQSVSSLSGADDSLEAINTSEMSPGAIVLVRSFYRLYVLEKNSTAAASSPNVVAPAQGGPGRWVSLGAGANYFQLVNVPHAAIPPQSSVIGSAAVVGALGSTQVLVYNCLDSGGGDGSLVVNPQITGVGTAAWRFANVTTATIAAGTVALEVALLA